MAIVREAGMASLAESWIPLREETDSRNRRLVAEVTNAWSLVQSITELLRERLLAPHAAEMPPANLESLEKLFGGLARSLLFEPLSLYRKRRPLSGVVSAIEEYEAGLNGVVQRLPAALAISGRELLSLPGAETGAGWRKHWFRWQRFTRVAPVRAVVSGHLQRHVLLRGRIDGAVQLTLAQSCLHLLGPWQMHREHMLRVLSGTGGPSSLDAERRRWAVETAELSRRMTPLLEAYGRWAGSAADRLTAAVLRSLSEPSPRTREKWSEDQRRRLSYWSRQQRAVQAVIELEMALAELGADMTRECESTLESIQNEHGQLRRELDLIIERLDTWSLAETEFPPPQVRLVSAEEHARAWARQVLSHAGARLPAAVEVVDPRYSLPTRRHPWRVLDPGKVFSRALENTGTPRLIEGFHEAMGSHQLVMREIERAREVVAFGEETARAEGPAGQTVARDAIHNAKSLLLYQRSATPGVRPAAEAALIRAQGWVLQECHIALEKGRVGLLAHLTRLRGLEAATGARDLFLAGFRSASRRIWLLFRRLSEQILIRIGWLPPPVPRLEPVSRRAHLGQVLDLQLSARDLPMIYRRLFRLAPVEESRFLIGRDTEMAGLAEALARWNSGQRASIVVVGARGSGKTSLLNCAISSLFPGIPVVRGQFSPRVTTGERMRGLLAKLLQLPEGSDLVPALENTRRAVIIEELERCFLRVINGFDPLRELLTLIYQTSGSTFWVFSINETAFRYLDAAMGLGRHFSHRINAMSVRREDLIGAILQRHELSGLRLEFAALPAKDPRVSRARRLFGLDLDPEQFFFDSLYRQSEGIFRSAFELWQGSIERIEGGVVHMRQPLAPDYRPLLSELGQEEHFILQAVLQHGGLTVEEVAQVTRLDVGDSGRRLERLRLLDILEPEPDCPGLRVRPEAGLFVRGALHRQNLS